MKTNRILGSFWAKCSTLALSALGLFALIGCSAFNREWSSTLKQGPPADSLAGPWEGQWLSAANGHHGKLRCIMTRKSDTAYEAKFHAKYEHILSFGYTVEMTVVRDQNSFRFTGQADLGKLAGGVYTYKGAVSGKTFISNYDCKYDHGTFEMSRPAKSQ